MLVYQRVSGSKRKCENQVALQFLNAKSSKKINYLCMMLNPAKLQSRTDKLGNSKMILAVLLTIQFWRIWRIGGLAGSEFDITSPVQRGEWKQQWLLVKMHGFCPESSMFYSIEPWNGEIYVAHICPQDPRACSFCGQRDLSFMDRLIHVGLSEGSRLWSRPAGGII